MKTTSYHGGDVRRILTGMITDRVVLARISARWTNDGFFDSPWANLIAGWCVQYYGKHGDVPGRQIESMFETFAERSQNEDVIRPIEKFLDRLSTEYESEENTPASDYVVDLAGGFFNKVAMRKAIRDAEDELDHNQPDAAATILANCRKIQLGLGSYTDIDDSIATWQSAFDAERQRSIVSYPGELGLLVNSSMLRDSLIAFMAPDKVGKTTWLIDLAYRAIRQRCRVAYFDAGDMTEEDIVRRLGIRAARRPHFSSVLQIPVEFDDAKKPVYKTREFKDRLTDMVAYRAYRKIDRNGGRLRLSCWGNDTLSVDHIISLTREWAEDGWVPDVVICDYADILAPPDGIRDTLDQIDTTWKRLRRLSQELHCLVITATQSNAAAYKDNDKAVLTRKNFSGRKTKLAHVNGMLALNVTPEEKKRGVTRVNWVVRRNDRFSEWDAVTCVGNFAVGQPVMISRR